MALIKFNFLSFVCCFSELACERTCEANVLVISNITFQIETLKSAAHSRWLVGGESDALIGCSDEQKRE